MSELDLATFIPKFDTNIRCFHVIFCNPFKSPLFMLPGNTAVRGCHLKASGVTMSITETPENIYLILTNTGSFCKAPTPRVGSDLMSYTKCVISFVEIVPLV